MGLSTQLSIFGNGRKVGIMKNFFNVVDIDQVIHLARQFSPVETEAIALAEAHQRVLAEDIAAPEDIPGFSRSIVDGFAVAAGSTFGASEQNPGYLEVIGALSMGTVPAQGIANGQAMQIPTGAMLPDGADSAVMVEYTETIDDQTVEVHRSVAPGQNIIQADEDVQKGQRVLTQGMRLRPQEIGLLAAMGIDKVPVHRRPVVGIISTGDEVVEVTQKPKLGQVRDVNSYTLAAFIAADGCHPVFHGISRDNFETLQEACRTALSQSDMVILSGGASVGMRDLTVDVLSSLEDTEMLVHGVSISPGKPTILARSRGRAIWGLPGHVTSAMVVYTALVRPFLNHLSGLATSTVNSRTITAVLSRNLSSAQGRSDFVRVRLTPKGDLWEAEPVLGKSGLIHTMVNADGLVAIDKDTEGLFAGDQIQVILI